ncbi:MAG TPA: sn-glycerol-3-phosphate ABC transporter ATP-binding protein UgpC [Geminicoccus sp.]|jgi:sn-glycerol 3-phosphate transport system ATP-binding protein|uniref:ABC transporter ATP-binding protein n=1 Tax=Geminicoccus sp. TaxID=2024832 RepID=UPI002E34D04A|nr:sn-glycerol-3-phosphate ABC transporter ATP-binding protein UgpC [Geminicoccus sp.]HEX2528623.1 sn-glycerol-3-phosphate ABC transporter ATP-binding protein UgpC [Geminicoccus sp.]
MADIQLRAVRKSFGLHEVVKGVDLQIPSRSFVVILGPSGCGKSTILRMIAGLEQITAGEVRIAGERMNDKEPRERHCAMVFQNYALYPHMSVARNISYPLEVAGVARAERDRRMRATAASVGLSDYLDRKPGQLSGGQRQRVAMARAMIREPKVFLFDEPLSNLDATLRVQMRLELRRLHARLGVTSVLVTHDQTEAMTMADLLVVMNGGRIEQVGTPLEVYGRPASRFVASFIGTPPMNLMAAEIMADGQLALQGLALPLAVAGVRPGPVVLGIRPEHVEMARSRHEADIELPVEIVEELGATRILHARLQEQTFAVATAPGLPFPDGATLLLRLPPSAIHLFDPADGQRLPGTLDHVHHRPVEPPTVAGAAKVG